MLNKNTLGVKSTGPIRSSPTYVQPKALISAEDKKSPIKDVSNYLNDIQAYFHKYDWLCHLATFFVSKLLLRWPSDKANIMLVKICYKLLYVIQFETSLIGDFLSSVDIKAFGCT